ncbi:AraC family transcriptional regulator [Paenibacillus pabuli]|uniref:AraC family transcriptional regulator n=1 Tax=Paenibacillus pabuli TaxID=1472 RepID=UPI003CEE109B
MDQLDFLFFAKRNQNQYIPVHIHQCYELVYYFGTGETRIGSGKYVFKPNTFALISPHVEHDERQDTEADVLYIGFYCANEGINELNGVFEDDPNQTIYQQILRMKHEFLHQQNHFSEMLNLLVGELSIYLQRLIGKKNDQKPVEDRMHYVLRYMDENFHQKITIESLAKIAGYSYDRFRHLFKEKHGVAPLQYLYTKRIEHAKTSLLKDRKMLISEIAQNSGFVSDAQFCSMFKRSTRLTPKQYREQTIGTI